MELHSQDKILLPSQYSHRITHKRHAQPIFWKIWPTIFSVKSQLMLLLKVSLQFRDSTRCHLLVLLTEHARKAMLLRKGSSGPVMKAFAKGVCASISSVKIHPLFSELFSGTRFGRPEREYRISLFFTYF